jgi:hypothetical protein
MQCTTTIPRAAAVVFSTASYRSLLRGKGEQRLDEAVMALRALLSIEQPVTRAEILDRTWQWKLRNRRDDAVIRSLLLSRSSANSLRPIRNDFAFELRAGTSILDFAYLKPGFEEGFEIKSRFDNVGSLETQVNNYRQVLPRISLIADASTRVEMTSVASELSIGLVLLTGDGGSWQFTRVRPAPVNMDLLSFRTMLHMLRRDEMQELVLRETGMVLESRPVDVFDDAIEVLGQRNPVDVARAVHQLIVERRQLSTRSVMRDVPASLRAVMAEIDPKRHQLSDLHDWLRVEV